MSPRRLVDLAVAGIASALAVATFGPDYFIPGSPHWRSLEYDQAGAALGFAYYVADAWRWPLFDVATLGIPDGVNIILTDSVPAWALLAKLLRPLVAIPAAAAFALWCWLNYVMQGQAALWVLRLNGVRAPGTLMFGACLPLALPLFVYQFYSWGMSANWLLIAAFGVYARLRRGATLARPLAEGLALVVLAAWVHGYLMAMIVPVVVAGAVAAAWERRAWGGIAAGALLPGLTAFAALVAGGAIRAGAALPLAAGDRGFYSLASLNLAGPFVPQMSSLIPLAAERLPGGRRHFTAHAAGGLPFDIVDQSGAQYSSYAYLGLAVLALALWALVAGRREIAAAARAHAPLVAALATMLLFAITNRATLGAWVLWDRPLPDWPPLTAVTAAFRYAGRFAWPAAYALVLGLAVLADRKLSPRAATLLLAAALAVEVAETERLRAFARSYLTLPRPTGLTDEDDLAAVLARQREVYLFPTASCSADPAIIRLQLLAGRGLTPINAVKLARAATDCAAEAAMAARLPAAPGRLVIFAVGADGLLRGWDPRAAASFGPDCRTFSLGWLCPSGPAVR
jgi:hypothetical protein